MVMNLGFENDSRFGKDDHVPNYFETLSFELCSPSVCQNVSMKNIFSNHQIDYDF